MPVSHMLSELLSLDGKIAVISGAASGIGAATAGRFAEARAKLHLLDINPDRLKSVQNNLTCYGTEASIHTLDLKQKADIDAFWENLGDDCPDVLVNNAGIYPFCEFLDTDEHLIAQVMNVNLHAVYWMCQHFIRRCLKRKRPGAIVNVASIEAQLPFKADLAHYTTTKAAVIALTRALARDYGDKGIRANVILPGGILTEGTKGAAKQVFSNPALLMDGIRFRSRLPLQRLGNPDEVARMILVLASELASYMTGAVIAVDGGFLSA